MAIIITFISISESPMDYTIEKYQITKEELREAMYGLYGPVPSVSSGNSIISVTIHICCWNVSCYFRSCRLFSSVIIVFHACFIHDFVVYTSGNSCCYTNNFNTFSFTVYHFFIVFIRIFTELSQTFLLTLPVLMLLLHLSHYKLPFISLISFVVSVTTVSCSNVPMLPFSSLSLSSAPPTKNSTYVAQVQTLF